MLPLPILLYFISTELSNVAISQSNNAIVCYIIAVLKKIILYKN